MRRSSYLAWQLGRCLLIDSGGGGSRVLAAQLVSLSQTSAPLVSSAAANHHLLRTFSSSASRCWPEPAVSHQTVKNSEATAAAATKAASPSPPLDFSNPALAFKSKTSAEIVRSLVVFRLCKLPWLVHNADRLMSLSKSIFGSTLVNWIVSKTFYAQFVGGTDAEGIRPTINHLAANGIHAVLDYAAEDDVAEDEGPKSRAHPTSTVIARTYSYEDELVCDKRMDQFLKSIDAARSADGQGFAAIKVTALGMPKLLERVSEALLSVRHLFQQFDEAGHGYMTPDEFKKVYAELFTDASEERMAQIFEFLDHDHDGKVDYVAFSKGVSVYDGAEIASRCKDDGPFARAALTVEELKLLDNMQGRVNTLAEAATKAGVRLMIDAEHTYFQPAIDAVVAELQRKYNRVEPRIYNTYQCYLKDAPERLAMDLERARREGYKFGCKLVRGAYMVLERKRAAELGMASPIWDTKEDTDACYNNAVHTLMPLVRDRGAEFMVASHNQASVEEAVAAMGEHGLPPTAPVYFGQLLGMSDHLSFILGANKYGAYKYVPFGGVDEVMPYLIRRAQENSDILGGVGKETGMLRAELRRRLIGM